MKQIDVIYNITVISLFYIFYPFNAKTFYPFKTPYIFLSGLWQPRDSLVLVEVCGDIQRGGCHSAAGGMVLGGDGGTVGQ